MRSLREIQQMGHFDPEKLQPDIQPDPMNGTVDIGLPLTSKLTTGGILCRLGTDGYYR